MHILPLCLILFKNLNQSNEIHYSPHAVEGIHESCCFFWTSGDVSSAG